MLALNSVDNDYSPNSKVSIVNLTTLEREYLEKIKLIDNVQQGGIIGADIGELSHERLYIINRMGGILHRGIYGFEIGRYIIFHKFPVINGITVDVYDKINMRCGSISFDSTYIAIGGRKICGKFQVCSFPYFERPCKTESDVEQNLKFDIVYRGRYKDDTYTGDDCLGNKVATTSLGYLLNANGTKFRYKEDFEMEMRNKCQDMTAKPFIIKIGEAIGA